MTRGFLWRAHLEEILYRDSRGWLAVATRHKRIFALSERENVSDSAFVSLCAAHGEKTKIGRA